MPLSAVYASVSACDVLVGVHGADLTRFLFLRPGRAALAQIVPLGVSPIARGCFAESSARMGLHYEQYDVVGRESSLSRKYALDDVVVADPETAKRSRGWDFVARVYLGGQNVSLDLGRFGKTLARLHSRALLLQQQQKQPRR
uniref:Uncharacterized protein n=1 Tax=Arundo donax TaxID=35708 RepID=A0A0A9B1R6_ARUDO